MRVKVDTMYQLTAKRVFLCVIPAFLPPLLLSLAPPLVLLCRQTMRVLNVNKTSRPTTATLATLTKTTEETQQCVRLTNAIKT